MLTFCEELMFPPPQLTPNSTPKLRQNGRQRSFSPLQTLLFLPKTCDIIRQTETVGKTEDGHMDNRSNIPAPSCWGNKLLCGLVVLQQRHRSLNRKLLSEMCRFSQDESMTAALLQWWNKYLDTLYQ